MKYRRLIMALAVTTLVGCAASTQKTDVEVVGSTDGSGAETAVGVNAVDEEDGVEASIRVETSKERNKP